MEPNSSATSPHHSHVVEVIEICVHYWPAAVTSVLLVIAALTVQSYQKYESISKLPLVGSSDRNTRWTSFLGPGSWDMYKEGRLKFKGRPFKITDTSKRDRVVLPHTMLPELAKYPEDILSGPELADEKMYSSYTMPDPSTPVFRHVLQGRLTPALGRITATMQSEVVEAMAIEFPASFEWSDTTLGNKMMRMVAMSTGRIFIGPECCRSEAYVEGATTFMDDLGKASVDIDKIPWILRPVLAPRLSSVKLTRKRLQKFVDILEPVIKARKQDAAKQGSDYQKMDDMTQWMIDSVDRIGQKELQDIALEQAIISFAAVRSTAQLSSLAILMLAAKPELCPMLLEDVNQALDKSGGEWTNLALQNMKKVDSFLKEISRYEPFTAYAFARKVMSPVTLSNGIHFPKGSVLEIDAYGVARDEQLHPDPDQFDALRFYKLRKANQEDMPPTSASSGSDNPHAQFVHVAPSDLTWGYGKRACPGRFFAANILKIIIATVLLRYDVRNVEGVEGKVETLRMFGIVSSKGLKLGLPAEPHTNSTFLFSEC